MLTSKNLKRCGVLAIAGGALTVLLTPLMSVGYYQSYAIPTETPPFWFASVQPFISFLFSFADEKNAYTTYGKFFAVVYLLFSPGIWALHKLQERAASRFEKFGYFLLIIALSVSFFGVSSDYWGIKAGWTLELLGMLLLQIAATLYGIALLRLRIVPITVAILMIASIPFCVVSFLMFKQIPSAPTLPLAIVSFVTGFFILKFLPQIENATAKNSGESQKLQFSNEISNQTFLFW